MASSLLSYFQMSENTGEIFKPGSWTEETSLLWAHSWPCGYLFVALWTVSTPLQLLRPPAACLHCPRCAAACASATSEGMWGGTGEGRPPGMLVRASEADKHSHGGIKIWHQRKHVVCLLQKSFWRTCQTLRVPSYEAEQLKCAPFALKRARKKQLRGGNAQDSHKRIKKATLSTSVSSCWGVMQIVHAVSGSLFSCHFL